MKPVHRRLLYAMAQLKLNPQVTARNPRVVGDVIGKYHPHGDTVVYDAMVRSAQDLRSAIRWSTGRGISGILMVITPPRCVTPKPS